MSDLISPLLMCALVIAVIIAVIRSNGKAQQPEEKQSPAQQQTNTQQSDAEILSGLLPPQFVVLDLETTGLNPLTDEIIEYGAILVTLGESSHKGFQALVKPSRQISRKITEITGITQAMLDADGQDPKEVLSGFASFIGELPLVTYNAEFDMGFIYMAAKRHGIRIPNRYTCALNRCRRAFPQLPSHRLAYVSEVMELDSGNNHRAIGDATRAMQVFMVSTLKLNQKVRWSKPPNQGIYAWANSDTTVEAVSI